ncbi:hypothetical protein DPMN_033271, partial [Dreissena polymorpha]
MVAKQKKTRGPYKKRQTPVVQAKGFAPTRGRPMKVEVDLFMECEEESLSIAQIKAFKEAEAEHEKANNLIKLARGTGNTLVPSNSPNTFNIVPLKPLPLNPPGQVIASSYTHVSEAVTSGNQGIQILTSNQGPQNAVSVPVSPVEQPSRGLPPPRPAQFLNKQQPPANRALAPAPISPSPDIILVGETPPLVTNTSLGSPVSLATSMLNVTQFLTSHSILAKQGFKLVTVPSNQPIRNQWAIRPVLMSSQSQTMHSGTAMPVSIVTQPGARMPYTVPGTSMSHVRNQKSVDDKELTHHALVSDKNADNKSNTSFCDMCIRRINILQDEALENKQEMNSTTERLLKASDCDVSSGYQNAVRHAIECVEKGTYFQDTKDVAKRLLDSSENCEGIDEDSETILEVSDNAYEEGLEFVTDNGAEPVKCYDYFVAKQNINVYVVELKLPNPQPAYPDQVLKNAFVAVSNENKENMVEISQVAEILIEKSPETGSLLEETAIAESDANKEKVFKVTQAGTCSECSIEGNDEILACATNDISYEQVQSIQFLEKNIKDNLSIENPAVEGRGCCLLVKACVKKQQESSATLKMRETGMHDSGGMTHNLNSVPDMTGIKINQASMDYFRPRVLRFPDELKIKIVHLFKMCGHHWLKKLRISEKSKRRWAKLYEGQKLPSYDFTDADNILLAHHLVDNSEFEDKEESDDLSVDKIEIKHERIDEEFDRIEKGEKLIEKL